MPTGGKHSGKHHGEEKGVTGCGMPSDCTQFTHCGAAPSKSRQRGKKATPAEDGHSDYASEHGGHASDSSSDAEKPLKRTKKPEATLSDDESASETPPKKQRRRPKESRDDCDDDNNHLIKNVVTMTGPFVKMVFVSGDISLLELLEVDGASLEEVRNTFLLIFSGDHHACALTIGDSDLLHQVFLDFCAKESPHVARTDLRRAVKASTSRVKMAFRNRRSRMSSDIKKSFIHKIAALPMLGTPGLRLLGGHCTEERERLLDGTSYTHAACRWS
jgi:hypothetical protein